MIAGSIYLISFYRILKNNFKNIKNLLLFIIFSIILFYNLSLTLIMGILLSQIIILIFNFKKYGLKNFFITILMLFSFLYIFSLNSNCKIKLINTYTILLNELPKILITNKDYSKNNIFNNQNDKILKGEKIVINNQERYLVEGVDLSSAVLIHSYKVALLSIKERPLGWGLNRYNEAFKHYTPKIKTVYHVYALSLNKNDGSINLVKLIVEFGYFSIILFFIYLIFLVTAKVDLQIKILLIPIVINQLFLRGAGYFNGGFFLVTVIIIVILANNYYKTDASKYD